MRGNAITRRLELTCFYVGTAAALTYCIFYLPAVFRRTPHVAAQVSTDGEIFPRASIAGTYSTRLASAPSGSTIGELSIPELRIDAVVVEGVTDSDLRRGVGHVPGSSMSGGLGNVVLAAHRDGIFRGLRGIKRGMDIQLTGPDGTYHYQVDSTEIVTPESLEVMAIGRTPGVTLVTCYPFNFIGSAPRRFIVTAHLVSVTPDA